MAKVEALNKIPIPRDVPRLRAFLGLANYYRRFMCNFSVIAKPLTQLTRTRQDWEWEPVQDEAFEALKKALGSAPMLRRPDTQRPFQLHTDWSAWIGSSVDPER